MYLAAAPTCALSIETRVASDAAKCRHAGISSIQLPFVSQRDFATNRARLVRADAAVGAASRAAHAPNAREHVRLGSADLLSCGTESRRNPKALKGM
jgi:hypothetical protein